MEAETVPSDHTHRWILPAVAPPSSSTVEGRCICGDVRAFSVTWDEVERNMLKGDTSGRARLRLIDHTSRSEYRKSVSDL